MAGNARINFTPNMVVGIGVALLGVLLTLDQVQVLQAADWLRFWPVMLILFGASIAVQALPGNAPTSGQPHQPIVFAPLLFLIIAGLFGVRVIGPRNPAQRAENTVTVRSVMSGNQSATSPGPFHGAEMTSVMGEARLDLRHAVIAPGEEASIELFTMMGAATIFVPDGWTVDVRATPIMGGVKDERRKSNIQTDAVEERPTGVEVEAVSPQKAVPPRLVVNGVVMMGGLVIKS
jgi:predicted membrane protein